MQRSDREYLGEIFRACRTVLGGRDWSRVVAMCDEAIGAEDFPGLLTSKQQDLSLPGFLPDLARLEWSVEAASKGGGDRDRQVSDNLNPTIHLLSVAWKNLDTHVRHDLPTANPEPGDALLLVWKDYKTGEVKVETATDGDLLALKIVVEELNP
ncbi:MAG TPA: hypothetical protein VLD40_07825, partial [Dissulfurispiraceae bacterium]|nr:hypothetical protein [Dissulfurispiraceae bacterium]